MRKPWPILTFGLCMIGLILTSPLSFAVASPATQAHRHHTIFGSAPERSNPKGAREGTHLSALVGDRESGLGFHALPNHLRPIHPVDRRGDAIRYAIATEAGYGYYYGIGGDEGFRGGHHHALFNPVDGYGSPFFAGYYGSARDDDSEPGPIGGTPYKD